MVPSGDTGRQRIREVDIGRRGPERRSKSALKSLCADKSGDNI
jgi:hypothetical protein